ncbi:hypothetical protein [Saccharomonospora cyanea]|uniref:Uncharacterized protein n=1 Tax=Saccharomonospora cyanea NA-134 TaxID=882082 RepID=H5XRB2_9PSEU|nr:hypothetical protein [Saccharomonospora cyanea]EHR63393.1 hypothetical protein SaccyDRAFT_4585 [Saccharomonospora cyanea NA-134]
MRGRLSSEFGLATAVPVWAWRFYRRHLGVVVGLSLLPSIQRLLVVTWGDAVPDGIEAASEAGVVAVRVLLLVLIVRWAFDGVSTSWADARRFVREHPVSLVFQLGFLAVAFGIFDVVAERIVGGALPESVHDGYLGVLLFVKNPTVIAFTFVWLVGVMLQLLSRDEVRDPSLFRSRGGAVPR